MPQETASRLLPPPAQGALTTNKRSIVIASIVWGVIIVGLLSLPLWSTLESMQLVIDLMTMLALAQLWNLLAGYAGMVSIGQQAWIGIGGYTLIVVADDLQQPLLLAIVLAGLVAAIIALPTAFLLFRLRGNYFSIGTWVIAEIFRLLILSNTTWLGGGSGRTLEAASVFGRVLRIQITCWLAIIVGIGTIALVYGLMRSRTGLGLKALRDSEKAAESLGVNTRRMKFIIFTLCAFGTSIVGAVIYLNVLRVTPDAAFNVQWSAFMFFIVIIGGIGTVEGPVIGAIIFFFINQYLADYGEWSLILLGTVAVIMMLFAPQGIWGLVQRRWGFAFFPVQRRLNVPPKEPAVEIK